MQETHETHSDRLIREFAENYMEKIFFFCLKKTGKQTEAEDLTQDIALQILTALNRGQSPMNFSAWVWQIARNRYSLWAEEKHTRLESVTGSDISDYELPDESESVLDDLIHREQLALLRRELAFIKRADEGLYVKVPQIFGIGLYEKAGKDRQRRRDNENSVLCDEALDENARAARKLDDIYIVMMVSVMAHSR